jgi:type II secretory pathway pseudopilin PulG
MNSRDVPRHAPAFSALQALVLVVVIVVLVAMLFPGIGSSTGGQSRRARARQDCLAIVHAIESYETEYGRLPVLDGRPAGTMTGDDVAVGDPAAGMALDNAGLFNVLRDVDRGVNAAHVQNPKRQRFFEAPAVSNVDKPKEGFLEVASSGGVQGAFYDPWGSQYNIVLDANLNGVLDIKDFYSDFSGKDAPRVSTGVFSLGKDRKLGTAGNRKFKDGAERSDDILSWEH